MTTRWGTKIALVVSITLTLVLFGGLLLIDNLGFKASPARLSTYLSPQSSVTQPNKKNTQYLTTQTDRPTYLASIETEILYDQKQLSFLGFVNQEGWKIYKQQLNPGSIKIVITPSEDQGKLKEVNGEVTVLGVSFTALAEGQSTLRISAEGLTIVIADAANTPSIYKASSSIQESVVVISSSRPTTAEPTLPALSQEEGSGGQRILSQNMIVGYAGAAIAVTLRYPARMEVEFGMTPQLGSKILTNEVTQRSTIRLSGLNESTQYFYRLKAVGRSSQIVSSMRSFSTGKKSEGGDVDYNKSELMISPSPAKTNSSALVVLRDREGNVIGADPSLTILQGIVTLTKPVNVGGVGYSLIESKVTVKQTIELGLQGDKEKRINQQAVFDPNLNDLPEPIDGRAIAVEWDRKTMGLVALLIGALMLSGLILSKLAKSR